MTTLIIGGTGNTGLPLAKLFHAAGRPSLLTTRSGKVPQPFEGVAFDWSDALTFENPFEANPSIDNIYIIAPFVAEGLPVAKPFLDLAISKNVKKFVLLASMITTPGGGSPFADDIYQYLIDTGVDYTVLRPTWFMDNFGRNFIKTIKEENYVATSAGDGKSPFVACDDIAKAAFEALTTEKYSREAPYVFGPQALSYGEATALLSKVLGRKIDYKQIPAEECRKIFLSVLPKEYADALVTAELDMAAGKEEVAFNDPGVKKHIGTTTFDEYFNRNISTWQ